MAQRPYEISLWSHSDRLITMLTSSNSPTLGDGYEPEWTRSTDGESRLSFIIPIKYYSTTEGRLVNNEKWYNKLKEERTLMNEKKIKLIFDKLATDVSGNYVHEIHEYVIESLTEERTENAELLCRVVCVGAAFKELGKTGFELSLSQELSELENEAWNVVPNVNYWLDKVFPTPNQSSTIPEWRYSIQMIENFEGPVDQIFERNTIANWETVGTELVPIYAKQPIEKARFVNIDSSNKYNITQEIAEVFQVFVRYEYGYEDPSQPFRITSKTAIFYDRLVDNTEYSITYGNNEKNITRVSSSADVVTKMFITPIESEFSDSGFVAASNARNNKVKDDFILNFDYFEESNQMLPSQKQAIPVFEKAIREINASLEKNTELSAKATYEQALLEAAINNLKNKRDSADENVAHIDDQLTGYNLALPTYIVKDDGILTAVKPALVGWEVVPRRRGVLANTLQVALPNGTPVGSDDYSATFDEYGYLKSIVFVASSYLAGYSLLKMTYDYDLLSFLRNERQTYISIRNAGHEVLALRESQLSAIKQTITSLEAAYKNYSETRNDLVENFNRQMAPLLKEGVWNESDYQPIFENVLLAQIPLIYDPMSTISEPMAFYREGEDRVYYDYIPLSSLSIDPYDIENLVIVESFLEGGTIGAPIKRELRYGSQWMPHFIYEKAVGEIEYDNLFALTQANISDDKIYFVRDSGLVYSGSGSSWTAVTPKLAIVFNASVKLDAANHSFTVHGASIGGLVANIPFSIAHRRWMFTESGTKLGARLENLQTTTLFVANTNKPLEQLSEFSDYYSAYSSDTKGITFKINNETGFAFNSFLARYQLDVSADQLYRDALDISKTSAFPEVTYEVSFSYLRDRLEDFHNEDYNDSKMIGLGSIVRITDHDLHVLGLKGIVTSITINLDRPEEASFTVQNYKTKFEDLFERIVAASEQMNTSGYIYNRVAGLFDTDLTLNAGMLQKSINNANLIFTSGSYSGVSFGPEGIIAETLSSYPNGVKGQTLIAGGGVALSNSVDANENRIWELAITPLGINANVIQTGRLDAGLVNIYSGDQIRFSWRAEGLFAYASQSGRTQFDTFVRYNEHGLLFERDGYRALELGWEGLYIGSQNGSVELTGEGGLEIYNAHKPDKQLLVKLGGFGYKDPVSGAYEDYGMKFYKVINGVHTETLVSTNTGDLWLKDMLAVGQGASTAGLLGSNNAMYKKNGAQIRIWAGSITPLQAPFTVTEDGSVYASKGIIGGFTILSDRLSYGTAPGDYIAFGQSGKYRLWAGNADPLLANFYVDNVGFLKATAGTIDGPFSVGGSISSRYFASGAHGFGWLIDGTGSAEFKDVYVRGTIAATTFEYQTVSSVGGSLYISPTLIFIPPSIAITSMSNKYVIAIPQNFTERRQGGRTWGKDDLVSLNGYIQIAGETYEIKDWRCVITAVPNAQGLTLRSVLDNNTLVCYNVEGQEKSFSTTPLTGGVLMSKASVVFIGRVDENNVMQRRGILLTTIDVNGESVPYIDVYDDQHSINNNMPKVRLGNLTGIIDPAFGPNPLSGYGLYSENVYLTGAITAISGYIGSPEFGFAISEQGLITEGRTQLFMPGGAKQKGIYLGKDGVGFGSAFLYSVEEDSIQMSGTQITMTTGPLQDPSTASKNLIEYIDDALGYRIEIWSTSDVLSSQVQQTVLSAKVWKGPKEVTMEILESRFVWTRQSADSFGDVQWNNNPTHKGTRTITTSVQEVVYSATYICTLREE